jgi:hypothetical protein
MTMPDAKIRGIYQYVAIACGHGIELEGWDEFSREVTLPSHYRFPSVSCWRE